MSEQLSEQEQVRRESLQQIQELGIDPYPPDTFETSATSKDIKDNYQEGREVSIAGRLMGKRVMGKASFAVLQDSEGTIQLYLKRDELCPDEDKTLYNKLFKKLLDIGDYIGVKGDVFKTKTEEITVHVQELTLLSKSLKPLPVVKEKEGQLFDAISDPQFRYRQRYVDLTVNPSVRDVFVQRTRLIKSIREYLDTQHFLEVETPILQPIYGGAAARPFTTHHNALDTTFYMRIADELYLKRLIVGGYERVYEIGKDFRNEGMDRSHNPEFTMLELYVAYKDYQWMMDLTEAMLEKIAYDIHGTTKVPVDDKEIDFQRPWKRYTMFGAIEEFTGKDVSTLSRDEMFAFAKDMDIEVDQTMDKGKIIDEIFSEKVEPNLIAPTFIMDYPIEMSPLAKKHRSKEGLVERFEVIVNGSELCNAFSELNDPLDQRKRFEEQLKLGESGDEEAMMMDEDFLRALEYGMPPTAGLGIGIDRLVMLMLNQPSIQDVLFFPQMRPEQQTSKTEDEGTDEQ